FTIHRMALQPDGKILLAIGPANFVVRLNADGSVDPTFSPVTGGSQEDVAVQADGKIVVSGNFLSRRIARFNTNGSLDSTFANTSINGNIERVLIQPDGKFLISGDFTTVAGVTRLRIARLNTDGTLDSTFVAG